MQPTGRISSKCQLKGAKRISRSGLPLGQISSTLRKKSQEIEPITIFPNPTSGLIFFSGINAQVQCSVFSISGKKLFEQKLSKEKNLDLSALREGLYLIQIQQRDSIQNFKVLLNR